MKKIVALLPMKENSERVPNKNFKLLGGKPLYQWILDSLCQIECIDNIVINTDSENILNRAFNNKKIILRKRNSKICGDFVSMNKVIEDDVMKIHSDISVMTHTTNPFLSSKTIQDSIDDFVRSKNDSLFTVNKYQTRFYDTSGKAINHDFNKLERTQDLDPYYEENSCLYIFSRKSFLEHQNRIGNNPIMKEIPKIESIDIDDMEDWHLAEKIAN